MLGVCITSTLLNNEKYPALWVHEIDTLNAAGGYYTEKGSENTVRIIYNDDIICSFEESDVCGRVGLYAYRIPADTIKNNMIDNLSRYNPYKTD